MTFAPSPPRSLGSFDDVCDIEEDDETISDDIFYEADHELTFPIKPTMGAQPTKQSSPEFTSSKQELTILSTVTSNHHNQPEDHQQPETETADNGVICAKIILSVNDSNSSLLDQDALENKEQNDCISNGTSELSSEISSELSSEISSENEIAANETNYSNYSDYVNEVIEVNHSNDGLSNDSDSDQTTVKTAVKMAYNEDTVCLPDIVVETKNLEHHNNSDKEK